MTFWNSLKDNTINGLKTTGKFIDDKWTAIEDWTNKPVKEKVLKEMAQNNQNGQYVVIGGDNATEVLEGIIAAQKKVQTPQNAPFQMVNAIPVAVKCPDCGEQVPVEAVFCPMCKHQLQVPVAKVYNTPPVTAAKVVGIGPKKEIPPTKKSFWNKIKKIKCPTAKLRARFNN